MKSIYTYINLHGWYPYLFKIGNSTLKLNFAVLSVLKRLCTYTNAMLAINNKSDFQKTVKVHEKVKSAVYLQKGIYLNSKAVVHAKTLDNFYLYL